MWSRSNHASLNNSGTLKFEISFYANDEAIKSVYNAMFIKLNTCSGSSPWIGLSIHLNNIEAHDKLVSLLEEKFRLDVWRGKSASWIDFDLKTLEKSEAENVFALINTVPSQLPPEEFEDAFLDMLHHAIPIEKNIPWGQSYSMFQKIAENSGASLEAKMRHGLIKK